MDIVKQMSINFLDMNRNADHVKADTIDTTVLKTKRIDLEGISLNGYVVQKILHDVKSSSNAAIADSLDEIRQQISDLQESITSLTNQLTDINDLLQLLRANTIYINQTS